MNRQKPPGGIEWCRAFNTRPGYTWNPIAGCGHGCRWTMPDGKTVICYAEKIANGAFKFAYPGGFSNITFHPDRLSEIAEAKEPSGIFICSMADLFGISVHPDWTQAVLDAVAKYPQHVFFSLTKNAPQLLKFKMPANLWVGVSAPPTFMFGKELNDLQRLGWFERALMFLAECDAKVRWVSLEPLSIDLSQQLGEMSQFLSWAVIGAGSDGRKFYQPDRQTLINTKQALDGVPIFFKGNMSRELAMDVFGEWPNHFPKEEVLA